MPIYNVTFGFAGLDVGWSETHALRANTDAPSDLSALAVAVAQKRVTFLGREFSITQIRISKYSDSGGTTRLIGKFNLKQKFTNPIQNNTMAAEPASVALLASFTTSAALAPAALQNNQSRSFCGAPPDDPVSNGGDVNKGVSNLGANFDQWANLMIQNGFGWLADSRLDDRPITSITQGVNGTPTIVTGPSTNLAFTPVIGQQYPARIRRVNSGKSPMNGQVNLIFMGTNNWVTTEVIGLALFQQGGRVRIYNPINPFCGYNAAVLQLTVAKHQRGRPFGSSRGRQPNRIRG